MPMRIVASLIAVLSFSLFATRSFAEPPQTQSTKSDHKDAPDKPEKVSTTEGQVTVHGEQFSYTATAGLMPLKDESGKTKADIFYVAYVKHPSASDRPITFVFNGGPGAASVWLHLGTVGPMHIALDDNGDAPLRPYHVEENPDTWLAATDLVFIDPVGTGYSRAATGEKPEQFFGVQEDIQAVAEFIRLYIVRNERWTSPKFLAGESYGTTRAAGLSQYLLNEDGIALNGIVLVSSVLDFQTISASRDNELPLALYLPSYTAIAHYHKKLPSDLQQADIQKTLKEVEDWAMHDYLTALAAGSSLSAQQRDAVAEKLARYTGLPIDYIKKADLRIGPGAFRNELLTDKRQVIGRYDARIANFNPDPLSSRADYDPSYPPFQAGYTAAMNDYVRRTLKFDDDKQYEVLTGRVQPWNFGRSGNGYLDVASGLQDAMIKNPRMKVLFANGTADLATPFMAARYTIDHLNVSPAIRANISHHLYEGGHMIYHVRESRQKLSADVAAFIHSASTSGSQDTAQAGEKD